MRNIESKGKKMPGPAKYSWFLLLAWPKCIAARTAESLILKGGGNLAEAGAKGD